MADSDTTGSPENAAGTTDGDSIGYSPEWTNDTFADLDHACIEMRDHGSGAVSVGTKDGRAVSLTVQQNQMTRAFSLMDADTAEWLADQLRDHAEAVRQAD